MEGWSKVNVNPHTSVRQNVQETSDRCQVSLVADAYLTVGDTQSIFQSDGIEDRNVKIVYSKTAESRVFEVMFRSQENSAILEKIARIFPGKNPTEIYKKIFTFIVSSSPTLNFRANDMSKLMMFRDFSGPKPALDRAESQPESDQFEKRKEVEVNIYPAVVNDTRPVYMASNLGGAVCGGAPAYGKSYFIAKKEIFSKSTLTGQDSLNRAHKEKGFPLGCREVLGPVMSATSRQNLIKVYEMAQGIRGAIPLPDNQYIEIQAFGLTWGDFEALVLDENEVERDSQEALEWCRCAEERGLEVRWYNSRDFEADLRGRSSKLSQAEKLKKANKTHKPK